MKKNIKPNENQNLNGDEKEEKSGKILDSLEGNVNDVEKALEGEDQSENETEAVFDPAARMIKNRKSFFVVGLIIILMAAVGLVSTVRFTMDTVKDIINQTSLKNEFAEFINPLVIIDAPAFDSTENIPPSVVISSAIWKILLSGNTDKYESDQTNMTISEIDVESAAAALFGYNVEVVHQTVNNGALSFEYNSSAKSYSVPVDADNNTYWPRVKELSSIGDTFTLVIEYMPPIMGIGNEAIKDPGKEMVYTVSRNASSMTVKAIQYPQTEEES